MLIGYARVSTDDQNLDLQHDALRLARCERIYEDRMMFRQTLESDRARKLKEQLLAAGLPA